VSPLFWGLLGMVVAPVAWFVYAAIDELVLKHRERRLAAARPPLNPFEDKLAFGRKRRREEVAWFYEAWDRIQPRFTPPDRNDSRHAYLLARAEREWFSTEMDLVAEGRRKLREIQRARRALEKAGH
jgi:hypothetical protein